MSGPDQTAAAGLRLFDLLGPLAAAGLLVEAPAEDAELSGISDDSREVAAGDLFCAWRGTASDGHDFAGAAVGGGAVALLAERRLATLTVPQLIVSDGRRAAAIAAAEIYGRPSSSLDLVAVTGTNGKTTTVGILRHLLGAHHTAASIGTLGVVQEGGPNLIGGRSLTTPGPVELARVMRGLVDRGIGAVAMEASSHALDQGRLHSLRFDAVVFTNLTRDHLDYHGSLEAYVAAKLQLVALLEPDGTAVFNADDAAWEPVRRMASRTVSFSMAGGADADVVARDLEFDAGGSRFTLQGPGGAAPAALPLPGAFNVQNALGAAGACLALGFEMAEVAERFATVPQIAGRMERIAYSPCTVFRDYAHTPDALERVLSTLQGITKGRLIVVFGAGGDRDPGKRPVMGAVVERWADVSIVTSDNPRTEDPDAIIDDILAGMTGRDVIREPDRRAAIARALGIAAEMDVVLLAGKGHEAYQVLGTESVPFDEREVVREILGEAAPADGEAEAVR